MYVGFHVKCLVFRSVLANIRFPHRLNKNRTVKLHDNSSSGSGVFPYGWTDMKLTVTFHNYANAPTKPARTANNILPVRTSSCSPQP